MNINITKGLLSSLTYNGINDDLYGFDDDLFINKTINYIEKDKIIHDIAYNLATDRIISFTPFFLNSISKSYSLASNIKYFTPNYIPYPLPLPATEKRDPLPASSDLPGTIARVNNLVPQILSQPAHPRESPLPTLEPVKMNPEELKLKEKQRDLNRMDILVDKIPPHYNASNEYSMKSVLDELSSLLNKYSSDADFIALSLTRVHETLDSMFKREGLFFGGGTKKQMWTLGPLFDTVNQHINSLSNGSVKSALRLRLANLPKPKPPQAYPHLVLTEKEKLAILITTICDKEKALEREVSIRGPNFTEKELFYLAKLVSNSSGVMASTQNELRFFVKGILGNEVENWDDTASIVGALKERLPNLTTQEGPVTTLYRLSKCRTFFERQKNFEEEDIFIPAWYHATKDTSVLLILNSGEIEVRHLGPYRGAFVSAQREANYGAYAFAMSNRVISCDLEPHDTSNHGFSRWRGLQRAISLRQKHFGLLSYPKAEKAEEKPKLKKTLDASGYTAVQLHSQVQLDYMQKVVTETLGCPDLPDGWWSGDKLYSEHQIAIQAKAKDLAVKHKDLFVQYSGQEAVAKVVQEMALPFYKEVMPPNPSYKSRNKGPRVSLNRNLDRTYTQEKVAKKETTARDIHGTMHATRVALWSQLLQFVYAHVGVSVDANPQVLALTAALHDAARENEGTDYWDDESAELVAIQLRECGYSDVIIREHRQAVSEKDPANSIFSTTVQAIVHDADCLDIMRLYGLQGFRANNLYIYKTKPEEQAYLDKVIAEVAEFIKLTDSQNVKTYMEHESHDLYGDLVRLLFLLNEKNPLRFKELTKLLRPAMQGILQTKENSVTMWLLANVP